MSMPKNKFKTIHDLRQEVLLAQNKNIFNHVKIDTNVITFDYNLDFDSKMLLLEAYIRTYFDCVSAIYTTHGKMKIWHKDTPL